ncbi:MAG TPA: CADD family putative folate metabolism protein [Dehalococcoidia bacterium]|nr:CADD family putative folate metabolism protein [Dehalococcoidia bacterium]
MQTAQFMADLDKIIANRNLLKHPFYQLWSQGSLSVDSLREYAKQYYKHVDAFPTYVSGAHSRCPDFADRQLLLENLLEEERGERNHRELWLRFGESLGLGRQEMIEVEPLPETLALDAAFSALTKDGSFVQAIAALYAYETQLPAVSESKLHGLREFYGISDRRGTQFFAVHKSIDVEHSRVTGEMLARYAGDGSTQSEARQAVQAAVDALWGFLDGVQREYVGQPPGRQAPAPA